MNYVGIDLRNQNCAGRQNNRPTKSADREVKGTCCTVSVCPGGAGMREKTLDTNRRFTESRLWTLPALSFHTV